MKLIKRVASLLFVNKKNKEWIFGINQLIKKGKIIVGRQINFYMDDSTQKRFLDFVKEEQFTFLTYKGNMCDSIDECFSFFLYKKEFGNLYYKAYDKTLDILNSPVIEVTKTKIKDHRVFRGRVWVSDMFYKENIACLAYCKKYLDAYQILYKWIRKNVPYQEINMGGYTIKEYANDVFVNIESEGFHLC